MGSSEKELLVTILHRFDGMDQRFDRLESKVDTLEQRFDGLEQTVNDLSSTVNDLANTVQKHYDIFEEFYVYQREHNTMVMYRLEMDNARREVFEEQTLKNMIEIKELKSA